jgi:hypothetical protein
MPRPLAKYTKGETRIYKGKNQRYNGKRWRRMCQGKEEDGSPCDKSAIGATDYCSKHGGGKRCQGKEEDGSPCDKSAQGATDYCLRHGGGKRCQGKEEDGSPCKSGAIGATDYCSKHGGGKRCQGKEEDGSPCDKSAQGATDYCLRHGGGKRCQGKEEDGSPCDKSAQGATDYCKKHGGGKRCQAKEEDGSPCDKSARGATDYCKKHGGGKRCEYDCCISFDIPSIAIFKNYFNQYQNICWSAAKNQMYNERLTIQEREAIGKYYGFNVNLVLRQEQAVIHQINATEIGKTLRTQSFGHSFDTDPIAKIFGKNKNIHHKKPDYCVLVNKYSIIIIEYDENSSHEKSRDRLNEIKEMFHLNVKEEIRDMELYTTTSSSSSSSKNLLKNIHIIRINGRDDDNEKRVCKKRERKETEGDYTSTKRYYELTKHGFTVTMKATMLLEEIYQIIIDSDDSDETDLQIYEIN